MSDNTTTLDTSLSDFPWLPEFQIGSGVNAATGAINVFSALEKPNTKSNHYSNNIQTFESIQSESSYQQQLEVTGKGGYNMELVNVSAEASFAQTSEYSEVCTTYIAYYSMDNAGFTEINKPKLSGQAEEILKRSPEEFRSRYGDYFVAGYKSRSLFMGIYICKASSSKDMTKFNAAVSATDGIWSAEASAKFHADAKSNNVTTSLSIKMFGIKIDPPAFSDIPTALKWFISNQKLSPQLAVLSTYSTISNNASNVISIPVAIFDKITKLAGAKINLERAVKSCPNRYTNRYLAKYNNFISDFKSYNPVLATNENKLDSLIKQAASIQSVVDEILSNYAIYKNTIALRSTEPAKKHKESLSKGSTKTYGNTSFPSNRNLTVHKKTAFIDQGGGIGHKSGSVELPADSSRFIVGWAVRSRKDHNGTWEKDTNHILGSDSGKIYIHGDYDRGIHWDLDIHYVDSDNFQFDS